MDQADKPLEQYTFSARKPTYVNIPNFLMNFHHVQQEMLISIGNESCRVERDEKLLEIEDTMAKLLAVLKPGTTWSATNTSGVAKSNDNCVRPCDPRTLVGDQ